MSIELLVLVEDNATDEALALRALKRLGLCGRAVVLRDGAQALDYFFGPGAESRALPVVVLLDLKLPKVDGHEVLRRLRAAPRTRALPVIVVSSTTEPSDLAAVTTAGATGFVHKAVTFEQFLLELKQALEGCSSSPDPRAA